MQHDTRARCPGHVQAGALVCQLRGHGLHRIRAVAEVEVRPQHLLWQQSDRLKLLPQSQGSSALTSSWKSGVSSTRLQSSPGYLRPHAQMPR